MFFRADVVLVGYLAVSHVEVGLSHKKYQEPALFTSHLLRSSPISYFQLAEYTISYYLPTHLPTLLPTKCTTLQPCLA